VAVSAIGTVMLTPDGVADVADAVIGGIDPRIVKSALFFGEGYLGSGLGHTECAVGGRGNLGLDHVDIRITMGIVAVPAEFTPLPDTGLLVSRIVLVPKMH